MKQKETKKLVFLILLLLVIIVSIAVTWFTMDNYFQGTPEKVSENVNSGSGGGSSGKVSITIENPEESNNSEILVSE